MPKLTIRAPRLETVTVELDGQLVPVPWDTDRAGVSIETDGPIYVRVRGQQVLLQPGKEGRVALRAAVTAAELGARECPA